MGATLSGAPDEHQVALQEAEQVDATPSAAPLWRAVDARAVLDGVAADEPVTLETSGRLALAVGTSTAQRALLFGCAAVDVESSFGRAASVQLAGVWELAGLSVGERLHPQHFGMASMAAPLPPSMLVSRYLQAMARLRGEQAVGALAEAAMVRWGLEARAKQRIEQLALVEQRALQLAAACVCNPAGLILDRPYDGLAAEHVAWLDERLQAFAVDRDILLLSQALSLNGPYAGWLRRASDVLLFRAGRLLWQRSGATFWQGARVIEVQVLEGLEPFVQCLLDAGMHLQRAGDSLLVSLGEEHDMQALLRLAEQSDTALLRCAPLLG